MFDDDQDDHFVERHLAKIISGLSLMAALACVLLMLNAALSSRSTDFFRRVVRSELE
jgi:hypothetical protein